ncbi:molybdenum cofactor guanylyltransferase [Bowmanella denitrificans]|uniref:molybdenum cofactor guanylyltransferase n=1 Tax=Bowmanella denitrificans TaxID=366582 RepID=UPI000C9C2869|nr:molybdenum cofactor guanylyltransferase [Bowmanella denitrificans]
MLTGMVLAGGRSSRMGQDKAMMELGGQTLLARATMLLEHTGCDEVLVSRNQPGYVQDLVCEAGPLGGIYTVLQQIPSRGGLLIVPVDMPALSTGLLQALVEVGRISGRPCCYQHCYLPLYLPVSATTCAIVHQELQEGGGSVKSLLDHFGGIQLVCQRPSQLQNINCPTDWQGYTSQFAPTEKEAIRP